MSLRTDVIFAKALQACKELTKRLPAGDVYNTSIPLPDADLDNAPLPYVIVSFDGMANEGYTKDCYEGDTDIVDIGVLVAARTRSELADLTAMARDAVKDYFLSADDDLVPTGYTLTADVVSYDQLKPCYFQTLRYKCETNP